ncbi:hypothetical protein BKA66DRAFT_428994 [Pyrenochaeta sp. MPI-SDFR-AT-0127]|nr:hypothetical protein BKA66DRAFT_428994 [Pyrenochaeta sp. MPI-SDFR-AT-0127]
MLPQHVLLALVASVAAVPLNINLGAYSPALVVGDGEISLGSTESASQLMATLASGAAQNANGEGQQAGEAAKRAPNFRRSLLDSLLGKRAPAPAESQMVAVEAAMDWIKRDLQGFQAALSYAREAMKDQPKVELGTEHAGIGILVHPGVNVPKDSAAAGATEKKEKRGEVVAEDEAPKMTLVAITEV